MIKTLFFKNYKKGRIGYRISGRKNHGEKGKPEKIRTPDNEKKTEKLSDYSI
jgi:hypothetical protein